MRSRSLLLTLPIALVAAAIAVSPVASADHTQPCPEYTHGGTVDDGSSGVWFNERGQFVAGAMGVYFAHDETAVVTGWEYIFSWWIYFESNGEPGLQRDDEYCYTEGYDGYPDTLPCFAEPRSAC